MNLNEPDSKETIESLQKSMEERTCRVGLKGDIGIVEKVFQARNSVAVRAKVLMESGAIRYVNIVDIRCY